MDIKVIGLGVSEELHRKISAIARSNGTTVTEVSRMGLVQIAEKYETKKIPNKEILKGKR